MSPGGLLSLCSQFSKKLPSRIWKPATIPTVLNSSRKLSKPFRILRRSGLYPNRATNSLIDARYGDALLPARWVGSSPMNGGRTPDELNDGNTGVLRCSYDLFMWAGCRICKLLSKSRLQTSPIVVCMLSPPQTSLTKSSRNTFLRMAAIQQEAGRFRLTPSNCLTTIPSQCPTGMSLTSHINNEFCCAPAPHLRQTHHPEQ